MRYLSILLVAIFITLTGCGGGDEALQSIAAGSVEPDSNIVTVKGIITTPDGSTPLVNATVYIAKSNAASISIKTLADVLSCDSPPETFSQATCTDQVGAFSLAVERSSQTQLTVKKGAFLTSFNVDTRSSTNGTLDIGAKGIADSTAGLPRIALVTGDYDRIQDVLAKSGLGEIDSVGRLVLGTEDFDIYDGNSSLVGSYPLFAELLDIQQDGQLKLYDYDIVFINCGVYEFDGIGLSPTNTDLIAALRTYVQAGGRLYVTDQSYDFIEQAFPEYLQFYGSNGGPSFEPETWDAAEVGLVSDSISASIMDSSLQAFLAGAICEGGPCLNSDNSVEIEGFLDFWAVMEGAHTDHAGQVKLLIRGPISTPDEDNAQKPLTAVITHGAGKLIYSSYHTEDRGSIEFLPQERILQFLVFE